MRKATVSSFGFPFGPDLAGWGFLGAMGACIGGNHSSTAEFRRFGTANPARFEVSLLACTIRPHPRPNPENRLRPRKLNRALEVRDGSMGGTCGLILVDEAA